MQEAFPAVFRHAIGFAIDHQLAVSRLPGISNEINLPLLTHLLPERYPQSIDPSTINDEKGYHPFRSYEAKSTAFSKLGTNIRLVQFEGQVGTGNRSIRSDQPFPPVCSCYNEINRKKNRLSASKKLKKMTPFQRKANSGRRQKDDTTMLRLTSFVGRLHLASDSRDYYLRPFVIPTIISDTKSTDNESIRLLIDLTPLFVAYFEVNIMEQAVLHECVSIGLSTSTFCPQDKLPGWDSESYGYHSDDGGMFHGKGIPPHLGRPSYGPGDIVGCGLEYKSRRIFFTKNGKFLGYEFDKVDEDVVESGLYPTVGVDSECPIFVNFGERPFCFDLKGFGGRKEG
jgi:hypothetical protein